MIKNKTFVYECEQEMLSLLYFMKSYIDKDKLVNMTAGEIYKEYEKFNVIGIEDGWREPSKFWMKKLFQ